MSKSPQRLTQAKIRKLLVQVFGNVRFQKVGLDGLKVFTKQSGEDIQLCEVTADKPEGRPGLPWAAFVGCMRSQGFEPEIKEGRIELAPWVPPEAPEATVT